MSGGEPGSIFAMSDGARQTPARAIPVESVGHGVPCGCPQGSLAIYTFTYTFTYTGKMTDPCGLLQRRPCSSRFRIESSAEARFDPP